jgi:pimeloyl-ACP methyl ester carboxylesterase
MADGFAGLLDALHIDATHVFGISMGGMIAQEFALTYPEKVKTLILRSSHCGGTHAVPGILREFGQRFIDADFAMMSAAEIQAFQRERENTKTNAIIQEQAYTKLGLGTKF